MSDPNSTAHFPSLDAWKRTNEAREAELERLYKRILSDIKDNAICGKASFVLHLDGTWYEVETTGSWFWRVTHPVRRLKKLIEKLQADGFQVELNHQHSNLFISWNLDQ